MIEVFYIIYSIYCLKVFKYVGPVSLIGFILLISNVLFSILTHNLNFGISTLNFFTGFVYIILYNSVYRKLKILYRRKFIVKELYYDKKLILLISIIIFFFKFYFNINFENNINAYRYINIVNTVIGIITYPLLFFLTIKNDRYSYLIILILISPSLFGESRGAIIFPILFILSVLKIFHKIKFDFKKLFVSGTILLSVILIVNMRRYDLNNGGEIITNIISRGDAIFHYKNANEMETKISRNIFEGISSSFLFFIPRNIWPQKPYLSTFELTKNAYNIKLENIVSVNMTIFWFEFIKNENDKLFFYILNMLLVIFLSILIRYGFKNYNIFHLFILIALIADLLFITESGFFDAPSGRKIIIAFILSPIGYLITKKLFIKSLKIYYR